MSTKLLNRDHHATYFKECPQGPSGEMLRRHGDYFRRLANGYYTAGGRTDDTMNLGGIKISSAEIEAVLNRLTDVTETAAVSVPSKDTGPHRLVVFVVGTVEDHDTLKMELNRTIRADLNPLFKISEVRIVDSLPRTASNKVMRRKLRESFAQSLE